ncbi:MAG: substrate-binding domain-containing protein [Spirochaetota bacterium]
MKKYEIVENWIKSALLSGRFLPGDQLPSESQICEELGVARNSVRQALGNLNAQGFVETRQGVGTFCLAPGHSTSGSRDVALLCFSTSTYIFPELVTGVESTLTRAGYHLLLSQTSCDAATERDILIGLRERGVAGIILQPAFGAEFTNADVVRDLIHAGVPVVLVDNAFADSEFSSVIMDDGAGGRLAASHLWERGHRDIAITYDADYLPKIRRSDGALAFLGERGVEIPRKWRVSYHAPHVSEILQAELRTVLGTSGKRPTAFCCSSDEEAMDVAAVAQEFGIGVPDQLSIVGFDNSRLATNGRVPLTTIDHPTQYMAELATTLLVHSIRYPDVFARTATTLEPRLVNRNSVLDLRSFDRSKKTNKEKPYASQIR